MNETKKGLMGMGGTVKVELTKGALDELLGGKEVTIKTDHGMEFYLAVKTGDKDAVVHFTPWFDMAKCRVKIENSIASDGEFVDAIEIILRNTEDRHVGFVVNVEQAEKLTGVLQHYAQARRAYEALRTDQSAA